MTFVFHPDYVAPLPPGHAFPMGKYESTRNQLAMSGARFLLPEPARREALVAVHDADYVDAVLAATVAPAIARRIGFPVTPAIARRALLSVGGTMLAAELALDRGFAANVAGGSHHAMPDGGAGYCVLNDLAVAALAIQARRRARRILILDLDVHQGDGTAVCLAGRPDIWTFSIHAERNFPARKARSFRDVGLPDDTRDAAYLAALSDVLPPLFASARPELVMVQAGVDPHRDDRLGRLALSDAGLLARDDMVRAACVAAGAPLMATLGGGYDPDAARLGQRHAASLLTLAGEMPAFAEVGENPVGAAAGPA